MKKLIVVCASMLLIAGCDESTSRCQKNCHNADKSANVDKSADASKPAGLCGYGECPADLGKHCDYNRDCATGQCVNHACRFESAATLGGSIFSPVSDAGSGGSGVSSGASGGSAGGSSGSAGGSSGSSGISGASNIWVAGGSVPSGSACNVNQECESGLCYKGYCSDDCELLGCADSNMVCRYGRCIPITTDGGECSFTETEPFDHLYYNAKYKDSFTGAGIIGCKDFEFCCNGFCTENGCESQISCQISKDCASNICFGYADTLENARTVCGCTFDEECGDAMFCGNTDVNLISMYDGYYYGDFYQFYYYDFNEMASVCKNKLQVGAACTRDAMCKLGACYEGKCVVPKNAESRCDSDGDCATQTCGEAVFENRDKWEACHADGIDCTIDAFCENKYDDGEPCFSDANCKSGYCSEKYGVCAALSRK